VPSLTTILRATVRSALTGTTFLVAGNGLLAQPGMTDQRDLSQTDLELHRRLEPLVPSVRAALEGHNRDAQRAALGIAADFPRPLATSARLPAAVAAFLLRDANDPELFAMALRAYGRMTPPAADLVKVTGRHSKAEAVDVRRATAEALASSIQNAAPEGKALANARYFIDISAVAGPRLDDALEDADEGVERAALEGIQASARIVTDIYLFDPGPIGDDPKPKDGTNRFDQLRPVLRDLVTSIPHFSKPLSGKEPATRLAAARALEALAITRRTILNTRPAGEGAPTDPFPNAWLSLSPSLEARISDADPQVRLATTQALESLGEAVEARRLLRLATADRTVFVRWTAARALGRSAPDKPVAAAVADDVSALAKLTADVDPDVRSAALTAIARFGTAARSASDTVLTAAARGDIEPRIAAVKALGAIQSDADRTVPILIDALRTPVRRAQEDFRLQRAAAAGLIRFGPDAKAALPELRNAVLSDDPELRLSAAEAILSIERIPRIKDL
jgi:HEAT repeats